MKNGILKFVAFCAVFAFIVSCTFGLVFPAFAVDSVKYGFNEFPFTSYRDASGKSVQYSSGSWPSTYNLSLISGERVGLFGVTFTFASGNKVKASAYLPLSFLDTPGLSEIILYFNVNTYRSGVIYNIATGEIQPYSDTGLNAGLSGIDVVLENLDNGLLKISVIGDTLVNLRYLNLAYSGIFASSTPISLVYPSGYGPLDFYYPFLDSQPSNPIIDGVTASVISPAPYYPGTDVNMTASVIGSGFAPGDPEDSLYAYVYGNSSPDTYIDAGIYSGEDFVLHIAPDETSTNLEVEFSSTYDTSKTATLDIPITYPLEGVQIIPSGQQKFVQSDKQRQIQYQLLLPNGDPFNYELISWIIEPSPGHENYYAIDSSGLLVIKPDAPVGSSCNIRFAYKNDLSALSPVGASVQIITQLEGIQDELNDYINGNHGFDPGGSDFSGAVGDLNNSQQQMGDAMSGGMNALGGMMGSPQMLGTLTTLGGAFDALFEGNEITICGVTANPFTLLVSILAIAVLIPLALKYVFRKRGGGSGG